MQQLDQKQKAQVGLLGVAAAGLFGYFGYQMLKVTPAAAHTQTASGNAQQTTSTTAKPAPGSTTPGSTTQTASTDASPEAPPPTPDMRDPFTPGIVDQTALEAYRKSLQAPKPAAHQRSGGWNKPSVPFVAPLPRPSDYSVYSPRHADFTVAPLPKAAEQIAAPSWTVTGLVEGGDSSMAILRNGDSRRMVRSGDMVDSDYRVIGIGDGRVTLAHGRHTYTLVLGAKPAAPTPAASTSTSTATSMPQANTPQDLGAPSTPQTGLPAGTVTPGGTEINPNALIKLPGGLTLPTVHLPAN